MCEDNKMLNDIELEKVAGGKKNANDVKPEKVAGRKEKSNHIESVILEPGNTFPPPGNDPLD